jgi:phenylacetate-CoA ligase
MGGALLVSAVPGEGFAPITAEARRGLCLRSASTLDAAGIRSGDRVLVSLNSDGDLAGAFVAEALVALGADSAVVGARGRMRTLAAMRALRPAVWITTPTGALDFLARLYLEFNVDPIELELRRIFLVGEIPSPGTSRRLADEFESELAGLYCDPIFGGLWGHGQAGQWAIRDSAVLDRAELARDGLLAAGADVAGELVLRPDWAGAFEGTTIRTGQVVEGAQAMEVGTSAGAGKRDADAGSLFQNTVGEHLLVRGRWLSLPLLRRALAQIDGLAGHVVTIERGEGTLDKLTIGLAFERPSLVENPMWAARAREAVAGITPVEFAIETELAGEATIGETIVDRRGHHLGVDRARSGGQGLG